MTGKVVMGGRRQRSLLEVTIELSQYLLGWAELSEGAVSSSAEEWSRRDELQMPGRKHLNVLGRREPVWLEHGEPREIIGLHWITVRSWNSIHKLREVTHGDRKRVRGMRDLRGSGRLFVKKGLQGDSWKQRNQIEVHRPLGGLMVVWIQEKVPAEVDRIHLNLDFYCCCFLVLQSHIWLCNPVDCSPLSGSSLSITLNKQQSVESFQDARGEWETSLGEWE